jgi:CheY-like chemotaxis protein
MPRRVLIIESDSKALSQMRRVLAGMGASVMAAADEQTLGEAVAYLESKQTPPALIIARVTLPSGSGVRLLQQAALRFPAARQLMVSHHPKKLLHMVPGFAAHCGHFLQEEFTDHEFREAVEQSMAAALRAG